MALHDAQSLKYLSLDDLLAMSDSRIEIIDGVAHNMSPVGVLHHLIAGNIFRILDAFVLNAGSGSVFMDGLIYLMHSETSGLRDAFVPDVSYIHVDSIPEGWQIARPFPGVPTLAVEVMSPDDKAETIEVKVQTYLSKGSEEVWVVFPEALTVNQYHRSQPDNVRRYSGSTQMNTSTLFPGLELTTDQIFHLPSWAQRHATK
jgi:Uma2 family endonuclease